MSKEEFPVRVVTCIRCDNDAHTTMEHDEREEHAHQWVGVPGQGMTWDDFDACSCGATRPAPSVCECGHVESLHYWTCDECHHGESDRER